MKNILGKSKGNKELAYSVIGQAIMDEADIGVDTIKLCFVSKGEAKFLWDIGNRWNLVNRLRRFNDPEGKYKEWGFSIKAEKRKEIYQTIGTLPNPHKDRAFRHLVSRNIKGGNKGPHGRTKGKIIKLLERKGPLTAREIMYNIGIGYGALKGHLKDLRNRGSLKIVGKNVNDFRHAHRRQANLWDINNRYSS